MRTDAFGPRTWLLAAIATWGVLAWGLALFGLGGQIRPLADDPSLLSPLPQLPAQAPERLGPLADYSQIAARPVTSPNRQPQPFFIAGDQTEQARDFDYVLSSVLITPQLQMAILQPAGGGEGVRLKVGEAPESQPAWRLVELEPRSAVLEGPEGRRTLELRVFDGAGGPVSSMPGNVVPGSGMPTAPAPAGGNIPPPASQGLPVQSTPGQVVPSAPMVPPASADAPAEPPLNTEQQMEAIRKRIEARRAQLREQGTPASPPNKTK